MADAALRRFYEALPHDILRMVGDGFDPDAHAMHRALRDPARPEAPPSPATLNSLIREALPEGLHVLDAGCGWGGTLLGLARHRSASGLGVTLSALQAESANAHAAALGVGDRVSFLAADYTAHPFEAAGFDAITAIETLIHCPDKPAALAHLVRSLRVGGWFVLVDDMPTGVETPQTQRDLARFRLGWHAPDTPSMADWVGLFEGAGLDISEKRDLGPLYAPRSAAELAPLVAAAEADMDTPDVGQRSLRQGELGGFALEALHGSGAMTYGMLLARRR